MSKFEAHTVRCPDCGHDQTVDIYISISADRMPDATDRLIDDSWERFSCMACGHAFIVDNRMLYTDLPHKRWIVRYPFEAHSRFRALEKEAVELFELEYLQRPPEPIRRQAAGVSPRICFGRPQLSEKLRAWRHDLNDSALECLKLVLLRDHADRLLHLGPSALRLVDVTDDKLTFDVIALTDARPLERIVVPLDAYRAVADNLVPYRAAFPDLFDCAFVNARRYLQ